MSAAVRGRRPHMAALIEDMELHGPGHEGAVPLPANGGPFAVVPVGSLARTKSKADLVRVASRTRFSS
jgi:hypothetical protein